MLHALTHSIFNHLSGISVCRLLTCLLFVAYSTASLAQESCECPETCPVPVYTNCWAGFDSHHATKLSIHIPVLQRNCMIEVHYCCRIRSVTSQQCPPYVNLPLSASCETAITCIKIPKSCVADIVQPGMPITYAIVRKQILWRYYGN